MMCPLCSRRRTDLNMQPVLVGGIISIPHANNSRHAQAQLRCGIFIYISVAYDVSGIQGSPNLIKKKYIVLFGLS